TGRYYLSLQVETVAPEALPKTGKTVGLDFGLDPWQRGTNENNNRLLRRSITKGTSLQLFSEFDVEQANLRLNSYPRKILGGKSSLDRFEEEILKIIDPETLAV
ncbi:hypothetical protein EFQ36_01955, partial [Limosilactobacillus fermentum]|nr:hypothetical protein [Limosilactobacillus fermentum]